MLRGFENLDERETELMLKAPILVCILIAGADGQIDKKEIREAISVMGKAVVTDTGLSSYFKEVSQDFEDKLKVLIQGYPHDSARRNPVIEEELSGLNHVLSKIDHRFAVSFYSVLRSLAEKIAMSSGGVLGYNAIGVEEARYLQLSMINPPAGH